MFEDDFSGAVVDKRFVDKTAILRKHVDKDSVLSTKTTKILLCRHTSVLFWNRKQTFKNKIWNKPSKRFDCLPKALSRECSGMLDAQPGTIYLASPVDPSHNSKFGFWSEYHCIYFLTIVFVDNNCRRQDEIWPDMSTKKFVLDDSTRFQIQNHCLNPLNVISMQLDHAMILFCVVPCIDLPGGKYLKGGFWLSSTRCTSYSSSAGRSDSQHSLPFSSSWLTSLQSWLLRNSWTMHRKWMQWIKERGAANYIQGFHHQNQDRKIQFSNPNLQ